VGFKVQIEIKPEWFITINSKADKTDKRGERCELIRRNFRAGEECLIGGRKDFVCAEILSFMSHPYVDNR